MIQKDSGSHRLQVTAAGYLGHVETVASDENRRVVVQLKRGTGAAHVSDPRNGDHSKIAPSDRDDQSDRDQDSPKRSIDTVSPYGH